MGPVLSGVRLVARHDVDADDFAGAIGPADFSLGTVHQKADDGANREGAAIEQAQELRAHRYTGVPLSGSMKVGCGMALVPPRPERFHRKNAATIRISMVL